MLVRTIRSGLAEAFDRVSAVAVTHDGRILASIGEPDRPIFYRSAIKLLQAAVVLECGARLAPEHVAVICASHSGHPVHLAIVRAILRDRGLGETDLGTPPSWPLAQTAESRLRSSGHARARSIFHNCSGKHAGFLRACVAQGWPTSTYLDPGHPLQQKIATEVESATGEACTPVGVDGCGAPALRGNCVGLARAFASISVDERYRDVAAATHRFPALVAGNERVDGRLGAWWGGPLKIGAQGLIGAGRNGVGLAAKSDAGSRLTAVMGIMELMQRLGMLPEAAFNNLSDVAAPPVLGGGRAVGALTIEYDG